MFVRILLIVVVLGGGYWLITHYGFATVQDAAKSVPQAIDQAKIQRTVEVFTQARHGEAGGVKVHEVLIDDDRFSVRWTLTTEEGELQELLTIGTVNESGISDSIDYIVKK